MPRTDVWTVLDCDPGAIVAALLGGPRRVLLIGPPGVGKSTLAAGMGRILGDAGRSCECIGADPGSPGFGVPGAVSLGRWAASGWQTVAVEPLCSLNASRFRLPLVAAVGRLARCLSADVVLLDAPGVVRGVAAAELLHGLVDAAGIDLVLGLTRTEAWPHLRDELRVIKGQVAVVRASAAAQRPGKRTRGRRRTELWDAYLTHASEYSFNVEQLKLLGTPPPLESPSAWAGRQVALLDKRGTAVMGEVIELAGNRLRARIPGARPAADSLLVRDAVRTAGGLLETAEPFLTERFDYLPPPAPGAVQGLRPAGRIGAFDVQLVNGVFGDPLLHLRPRYQRRSLLFDLGEGVRLSARIAHEVTDVFVSHAHMDHLGGFVWLLRARIGLFPPCRLFGPPGLGRHIEGLLRGFLWDRVAGKAPCFEVAELHGDRLLRFRLQVDRAGYESLPEFAVRDGVIYQESGFRIRAAELDHHTPVLAFALEPEAQIKVRKDRLVARSLAPGPWLGELKARLLAGRGGASIRLPNGRVETVAALGAELTLLSAGKKLAYATDFADTAENRRRITALAAGAHTFFCEAPFLEADVAQARRSGHLTARACGEIALAAGVARLVPFHFSRRYEEDPDQIYEEIEEVFPRVARPAASTSPGRPRAGAMEGDEKGAETPAR